MPFGRDEHSTRNAKLSLVRQWLEESGASAVVLTQAASVAWLTGGLTNPVERGHPASPLWIVVRPDGVTALTSEVEAPRLEAEGDLQMPIDAVSWFEPGALAAAAEQAAGAPSPAIASDGEPAFGIDASDDLAVLRLRLLPDERQRLRALAHDAALALEESLKAFRPGESDREIQARIADALERRGALAVCLIVGGDDRVERFRHPLSLGVPVRRLVMAVVVAERGGLHAAATRYASAAPLPPSVRAARAAALSVESAMLAASTAGVSYGDVLRVCDKAYTTAGHPAAWREHYQGGPIGYRQREFEIAPPQAATSRFARERIEVGHALAWNPSVLGGGKAEDTYLVEPAGAERITDTRDWPLLPDGRPAVLDITRGVAA
jgi:Xaa-Pro dipeptidase